MALNFESPQDSAVCHRGEDQNVDENEYRALVE
jgi:hypothetical protein